MRGFQHHRDLHTGASPWQSTRVALPPRQRLQRDRHCDVLVIGAGISGAMVAEALSATGLHTLICDRRMPLRGSTLASTALVLYEFDQPLLQLARRIGKPDAERIWRRSRLAVVALRDRARQLGISAGLQDRDSLYLQGNVLDARGLQAEAQARRGAGFELQYLTAGEVEQQYGIRGRAGLRSPGNFVADPRQLAAGFLRAAAAQGAELFAPEEVCEVKNHRSGARARLRSGHHIHARHVVFATGYELPAQVPAAGHRIVSTWAIGTVQQQRLPWPDQSLIWEASSPYLYLRTTADGHVLCGGGDENIADAGARDALLQRKSAWLQRRLSTLLPRVDARVRWAWTGSFGASEDSLPTIGRVPGQPHCFAVLGYGGNGITCSMMAAQMLRNELCGDGDGDLELVRFGR